MNIFKRTVTVAIIIFSAFSVHQSVSAATIQVFQRDDCGFCRKEKEFLKDFLVSNPTNSVVYYDVVNDEAAHKLFISVTESAGLPKVTPLTVIGASLIQGFESPESTGERIAVLAKKSADYDINELIRDKKFVVALEFSGCGAEGDITTPCTIDGTELPISKTVSVPFFGTVSVEGLSLVSMSALLGFVDGFNPCAMWVLITFLLILAQIGNKRRMWQIAGLFMVAEALMYNLILNIWYATWDFVALDAVVTPLVGVISIVGGVWFLQRFWKSRKQSALVCDITSEDTHSKLMTRMEKFSSSPLTIATALGVIGLAFSVNIIEFACSIGIPQAYTKLLEINNPSFLLRQWYLAIYTLFYMIDDFIVFALAVWGFNRLQAHGALYAAWSALIGGVALLLLGFLLIFAPSILVF